MYTLEQFASDLPWWANAPWGAISLILMAFLAGYIFADLTYPGSWLRQKLSNQRKLFDVEYVSPVTKTTAAEEWYELTVSLRFLRQIRQASVIMHVDLMHEGETKAKETVVFKKNTSFLKGENPSFVLATIPRGTVVHQRSCWGPPGTNSRQVLGPMPNVIRIDVTGNGITQSYRVYLKLYDGGDRFFFMGENYEPFEARGYLYAAP